MIHESWFDLYNFNRKTSISYHQRLEKNLKTFWSVCEQDSEQQTVRLFSDLGWQMVR